MDLNIILTGFMGTGKTSVGRLVARMLEGSRVMPICVVGFPLGAMATPAKAAEAAGARAAHKLCGRSWIAAKSAFKIDLPGRPGQRVGFRT